MDGLGNQLGPDADTLRDNIGFVGSPHCCIQDMKPWIGADGLLEAVQELEPGVLVDPGIFKHRCISVDEASVPRLWTPLREYDWHGQIAHRLLLRVRRRRMLLQEAS